MLRRQFVALFAFSVCLPAAILPDRFGPHTAPAAATPAGAQAPWWQEFAFREGEARSYAGPGRKFTVTAWRFDDPTGAAAAFDASRPPGASSSRVANLSSVFPGGELVVFGNYLLRIEGWQPAAPELVDLAKALPKVSRASLPILRAYLPVRGKVPNSERYILGPQTLAQFAPQIPPEAARFDVSTEAAVARYRTPSGEITAVIFSYPTPQMARELVTGFEQIQGAVVKRTGPLIAVIPNPTAPSAADAVLSRIEYRPDFMWAESVREPKVTVQDASKMILAIAMLAGLLILGAFGFGLLFGTYRIFGKRFGIGPAESPFTALHLGDK